MWVACGKAGLALWRDRKWHAFQTLAGAGLPRELSGVIADDHGGLWLASVTGEGLVRFERSDLQGWLSDSNTEIIGRS